MLHNKPALANIHSDTRTEWFDNSQPAPFQVKYSICRRQKGKLMPRIGKNTTTSAFLRLKFVEFQVNWDSGATVTAC